MRIPNDLPMELKLYYYYTTEDGNVIMCVPEALLSLADKSGDYSGYMVPIPVRYALDRGYRVYNNIIVVNAPYDATKGIMIDDSYYDYTRPDETDDLVVLEVGKCYPKLVSGLDSLCAATISESGIDLHVEYANPTQDETSSYASGDADVRFADAHGAVFLLAKFGGLNWIDCPVYLNDGKTKLDPVSPGHTYALHLSFFDSKSGKLLALRTLGISRQSAIRLYNLYVQYKDEPYDPRSAQAKVERVYASYSTTDLLRFTR